MELTESEFNSLCEKFTNCLNISNLSIWVDPHFQCCDKCGIITTPTIINECDPKTYLDENKHIVRENNCSGVKTCRRTDSYVLDESDYLFFEIECNETERNGTGHNLSVEYFTIYNIHDSFSHSVCYKLNDKYYKEWV